MVDSICADAALVVVLVCWAIKIISTSFPAFRRPASCTSGVLGQSGLRIEALSQGIEILSMSVRFAVMASLLLSAFIS